MPFAAYLEFLAANGRFAAFGFLIAFGSSFGQTFFLGVFGPHIQAEFSLSHTDWGGVYMAGTLASAALLPWTGKFIDRLDLRVYTLLVVALLAVACLFTARVAGGVGLLIAVLLLRQSGQGLMSHVAVTSMARYFHRERGRAIAVASIGFAAGEALLPVLVVVMIAWLGWRQCFDLIAMVLVLVLMPLALWLCSGHTRRHRMHMASVAASTHAGAAERRSWTRAEVLHDTRFWLLLPGLLAPALILTALFFHHLNIADAKGWTHAWITGSYVVYAGTTTLVALGCGTLIDRLGAARLLPYMLAPLIAALLLVWAFDSRWVVWPYLALAGVNVGIAHTGVSALWPELYGTGHLGSIKSLAAALSVFASALGPVSMGALADLGMPIDAVCLVFAGYAAGAALLMRRALRDSRPVPPRPAEQ